MLVVKGDETHNSIYRIVGSFFVHNLSHINSKSSWQGIDRVTVNRIKLAMQSFPNTWGDNENWQECAKNKDTLVRMAVAKQGKCLDVLKNDNCLEVRLEIIKRNHNLGFFLNDCPSPSDIFDIQIRMALARQGYRLDLLKKDKAWQVRLEVAKQGYNTPKFTHDRNPNVRKGLAELGIGLNELLSDRKAEVRKAVAKQGYGLNTLVNDPSPEVRAAVASHGFGIEKLIHDESVTVRIALASNGYGLDALVKDNNQMVALKAGKMIKLLDDIAVESENCLVRN